MPMNPLNPPGQRDAPFRSDEPGSGSGGLDATLKIESMLLEEFNYASTTAYQAMEDRARMFNMYLLVVGILGSAFGAIYPLGGGAARSFIQPIAAVVLFAAGVAGIAFFVLLIRLRQAFRQSLITMNIIKEFYIREFQQQLPAVQHAFRWRLGGIPAGERRGSATYIVCHMVGFIGALCFAGCAFMSDELLRENIPALRVDAFGVWQSLALALVVFVVAMAWMVAYYGRALNAKDEQKMLDAAEREVEKM
jgi:hypothetical protein